MRKLAMVILAAVFALSPVLLNAAVLDTEEGAVGMNLIDGETGGEVSEGTRQLKIQANVVKDSPEKIQKVVRQVNGLAIQVDSIASEINSKDADQIQRVLRALNGISVAKAGEEASQQ